MAHSNIIPIFNIVFAIILLLTGLKIIKPIKDEEKLKKYTAFFIIGGIGMLAWGIFNVCNIIQ